MRVATFSRIRPVGLFASLLLISSGGLKADADFVSGGFSTVFSFVHDGSSYAKSSLGLQGTTFSLSGTFNCQSFTNIREQTFNPTISFTQAGPLSGACPGNSVSNTVVAYQLSYGGQMYSNVKLTMNFVGRAVTVPNSTQYSVYEPMYGGATSGVAFTMTGLVSVYSDSSDTGTALFSIPISGAGTYSASGNSFPLGGGASAEVVYQFLSSPVGFTTDTTTQGAWSGSYSDGFGNDPYGGDGYMIANGPSFQPSYAAVSLSRAGTYTWASSTTDPRALQQSSGSTTGMASAYTGNNFDIDVYFTDSYSHRVSLYLLDFDTNTRSETITITDGTTGLVLDTESFSNFHNGVYANFDLHGNVKINVASTGGASAVVSGIFFGPGNSTDTYTGASSILFQRADSTTQGAWTGKYGSKGYVIANDSQSVLTTAGESAVNAMTYTWVSQTNDPRALQSAPGSSTGIASAFTQYPGTGFSFNLYNANTVNQVTLYLLDWDNEGRSETITVRDLSTSTILSQATYSNFQNGLYVPIIFLGGNVTISIQPVGSTNAVVSGIFFD